jgi:hypothetical protein
MPILTDLHFISDDQDYFSILDQNRFKEFLLNEWAARTTNNGLHFYRKLSSFFKEHFPHIKLASELEKELSIKMLATSGSFSETHSAVARLVKHTQFTAAQRNDIVRAAISNKQVSWIIEDEDVQGFLETVLRNHEGEIEETLLTELRALLQESKPREKLSDDDDDIPF